MGEREYDERELYAAAGANWGKFSEDYIETAVELGVERLEKRMAEFASLRKGITFAPRPYKWGPAREWT